MSISRLVTVTGRQIPWALWLLPDGTSVTLRLTDQEMDAHLADTSRPPGQSPALGAQFLQSGTTPEVDTPSGVAEIGDCWEESGTVNGKPATVLRVQTGDDLAGNQTYVSRRGVLDAAGEPVLDAQGGFVTETLVDIQVAHRPTLLPGEYDAVDPVKTTATLSAPIRLESMKAGFLDGKLAVEQANAQLGILP